MAKKSKYTNREVSWLYFNERVLQEAMDNQNPIIERLKFLGIFSNNRDEFFRVRVATLKRMIQMEKSKTGKFDFKPATVLKEVRQIVEEQEKKFTNTFVDLKNQLVEENIIFVDEKSLTKEQGKFVQQFFHQEVRPFLFPIMLKNISSPEAVRDNSIYLAIELRDKNGNADYALIMVPTDNVPRFIRLPGENEKNFIIFLDDVLRYSIGEIFKPFGYVHCKAYTIKFTRDAELDIDNDFSKSFIELISESLKKRKKGAPVRFVYDKEIPDTFLEQLLQKLQISEVDHLRGGGKYHNFKDFMSFPKIGSEHLNYEKIKPLNHPLIPANMNILDAISRQDIMLHYPYQSFQYIVDLLRGAAIDPKVKAIKMTLYRAARNSNVINALINASRNGKAVTVFLEIQARFDEEANIYWGERLTEEGVKVIKTLPGFKVHAKLMLIRRKEENQNVYYANISTGNFNEATAKIYADDSLLTANQEIAREVNMLFHLFESPYNPPRFKHLLVAPYFLRHQLIKLLNTEIRNVKAGKEAWVILKLNNIVDEKIADKLYKAAASGVKIEIICRGICILNPDLPALKGNMRIVSIIDKFLEHSRFLVFANAGEAKYYFGSADWMVRNLDHRFEVICPVYDKRIKKEIMDILQIQLSDNVKARWVSPGRMNEYKSKGDSESVRAQFALYDYFKKKLS